MEIGDCEIGQTFEYLIIRLIALLNSMFGALSVIRLYLIVYDGYKGEEV